MLSHKTKNNFVIDYMIFKILNSFMDNNAMVIDFNFFNQVCVQSINDISENAP